MNINNYASIHDILSENKRNLRKMQINQLFQTPEFSPFDTSQFQHHPFMITNQMYTFFVHQLQKWNQKLKLNQVTPFSHAEYHRNTFVYSSLKIISLKKATQIDQYLDELNKWYSKNSYNIPQTSVLMKKYNPNQEWQIRKTFKSNQPLEINNYRRRFLFSPICQEQNENKYTFIENDKKKKENCFFETKMNQSKMERTHYRTASDNFIFDESKVQTDKIFEEITRNKDATLVKLRNQQLRREKEQKEIQNTKTSWKRSHGRLNQKTCQNFYKGHFNSNKLFYRKSQSVQSRHIHTALNRNRFSQSHQNLLNQIKFNRLKTSQGIRHKYSLLQANKGQPQNKEQSTKQNWNDEFVVEQKYSKDFKKSLFNMDGVKLMSNPFDSANKTKIKKKKRV